MWISSRKNRVRVEDGFERGYGLNSEGEIIKVEVRWV
jgi:hypothetical protein